MADLGGADVTHTLVTYGDGMGLLDRLEKARGMDRRLDAMIHAVFSPEDFPDEDAAHYASYPEVNRADMRYINEMLIPYYTSSIDAAVGLVEKLRPGIQVNMYHYGSAGSQVSLGASGHERHEALTTPLAILLALLRSKSEHSSLSKGA